MAKKMVAVAGSGGVLKKRIIKRNKKKTIHKVIDYLLSDCYLYAPLIISSSSSSSSSSPFNPNRSPRKGIEIRERRKDKRSLLKKIEDYLKSDCYMYAPLVTPQSFRGCVGHVKKVSTEVLNESGANMTKEKRICTSDLVDRENLTSKESSKRSVYSNCRLIEGEGRREAKMRKIVVD